MTFLYKFNDFYLRPSCLKTYMKSNGCQLNSTLSIPILGECDFEKIVLIGLIASAECSGDKLMKE